MRRRVTFSRNYTLSLSRTCQCYCKYCAFSTHKAHLYSPDEVDGLLDEAVRRRAKELLVLTGERPEVDPLVAARLREYGHEDFTSYVVWTCQRALERGPAAAHEPRRAEPEDLARLREVTASQGLMLESISERLMETVHAGSPTKHPARRLETIRAAGELRIPFTSGILVGLGETEDERDRLAGGARRGAGAVRAHPGGHPPELRPARALLRPRAGADRRRQRAGVLADGDRRAGAGRARSGPAAGLGLRGHDRGHGAPRRRDAPPDAGRRDPGAAEPRRLVAASSSPRARPTSAGSAPTATTSHPSTRSPAPTRCASACSRTASR